MVFWILIGLVVAVMVGVGIYTSVQYWAEASDVFLNCAMAFVLGGAAAFIVGVVLVIMPVFPLTQTTEESVDLAALGSGSEVDGRSYFLGGGYVNEERVLNYVSSEDGAYRLDSARAYNSVIYQDEEKSPRVIVREWEGQNPWIFPFAVNSATTYEFHIPDGSILENYTISNQ